MVAVYNGLVHLRSSRSVSETVEAFRVALATRNLRFVARVDHAGDAANAGLAVSPAELLIFGNPVSGTPLMIASPASGIDLPLKALVWQDEDGRVWVSYNSPDYLQKRHGFPEHLVKNIAGITSICEEAAR